VDPWRTTYEDVTRYQSSRAGKLLKNVTWIWVLDDVDKMAKVWENFRLIYIIQPTKEGWNSLEDLSKGIWDILYRVAES
jgi:cytochrome oxidase Cu insertion factor (SCO1/SenC/PrrC family)